MTMNAFFEQRYSPHIMRLTYARPRTVEELSSALSIPLQACQMLVKMLSDAGMIKVQYRLQRKDGSQADYFGFEPTLSGGFVFRATMPTHA